MTLMLFSRIRLGFLKCYIKNFKFGGAEAEFNELNKRTDDFVGRMNYQIVVEVT